MPFLNKHKPGPLLPDLRGSAFEPSAANGVTLREAKPNEKLRHGKNAFTVGGSDYKISQTILNGGMGIVYRAEKTAGTGPERVVIKQSSFVIDESLVTAPDTVAAFVNHWQQNSPRIRDQKQRAEALRSYVVGGIRDQQLAKVVEQAVAGKQTVGEVQKGLEAFSQSHEAQVMKGKIQRMQAEFVREYAILRLMQEHGVENVPHVYDAMVRMKTPGSTEKNPLYNYYFAQQEAKGESIVSYYNRGGRLLEKDVIRIALKLGHTLEQMHELGIIHRDVTYNNVFIYQNEHGEIDMSLLIDYGAAVVPFYKKGAQTVAYEALSKNPELIKRNMKPDDFVGIGTEGFMAPEVATTLTRGADTFGLGRLIFFMMTDLDPAGRPEDFARQLGQTIMSPQLKEIVRQATYPIFSQRWYVDELVDALEAYKKPPIFGSRRPQ